MKIDMTKLAEVFSKAVDETITTGNLQLDFSGDSIAYPSYHQMKVAHFAVHLAEELHLKSIEILDLFILGLLHDIGFISTEIVPYSNDCDVVLRHESMIEHCIVGEQLLQTIKFNTDVKNVIMFHHEKYDGTGYFGAVAEQIPLFSQIISIADVLDLTYNLNNIHNNIDEIIDFLNTQSGISFNPQLIAPAISVCRKYPHADFEKRCSALPEFMIDQSLENILSLTYTIMAITDHKSHFTYSHSSLMTKYVDALAEYYLLDHELSTKLHIAANLHDLGKIYLSKRILEKPLPLTEAEYDIVKKHPQYGENLVKSIGFFDDIAIWIGQHHEKLDGSGYPKGLLGDQLPFESRVLAVSDIYAALTETRPYRKKLSHLSAAKILTNMAEDGKIDIGIVKALLAIINEKHK
jgi:putative nucleotidyltransferase with HDIG domain